MTLSALMIDLLRSQPFEEMAAKLREAGDQSQLIERWYTSGADLTEGDVKVRLQDVYRQRLRQFGAFFP